MNSLKIPFPFFGRVTMKNYAAYVTNEIDAPHPLGVAVTIKIPFGHLHWEGEVNGEICEVRQKDAHRYELIPIKS